MINVLEASNDKYTCPCNIVNYYSALTPCSALNNYHQANEIIKNNFFSSYLLFSIKPVRTTSLCGFDWSDYFFLKTSYIYFFKLHCIRNFLFSLFIKSIVN